ncbi:type II toxin-antitoxin system VapC family toxin [Caulobacter sp. 1776]|uniref:type II toxin-antitoxin system VapC family toxin n=1 Tax=Caulobacter sp. 1776 TaxID=3156420 RepID=UPI00339A96CE
MFVDASAWTAIILSEPEADAFEARLLASSRVLTSALANWETVRAVMKSRRRDQAEVRAVVADYQRGVGARIVEIGASEQEAALEAHACFGKGVHPAALNMGDCFAYACAKVHGAPLLYKGQDFALTDIEAA